MRFSPPKGYNPCMNTRLSLPLAALGLLAAVPALAAPAPPSCHPYHLVQKVTLGGEGGWDYLTVDAGARRLYISRGTHVMVVNADTLKVVGDIPNTNGVHGIAFAPKLGRGFTSNGQANTVTIFDLKTLKPLGTAPTGDRPDAILYDPATQRVFTFNGGGNSATAIDAATGKVVGTIPLGGRPEFAAADGKGMVYDNIEDKSEVVAIDARTLAVTGRWPIAPLESPSGLAIDARSRRLFAVCDGQKMAVVNADTGKVVATPAIGNGPDAAAFDPGTGLAFSSNGQDGTLTVVREDAPNSYRVVQTVPTQAGARTMAVDTKTHRVFLVTAMPGPQTPGAPPWRRAYVPGTFTLLVVGP